MEEEKGESLKICYLICQGIFSEREERVCMLLKLQWFFFQFDTGYHLICQGILTEREMPGECVFKLLNCFKF